MVYIKTIEKSIKDNSPPFYMEYGNSGKTIFVSYKKETNYVIKDHPLTTSSLAKDLIMDQAVNLFVKKLLDSNLNAEEKKQVKKVFLI